jgi:hypothetical protein
VTTSSIDGPAEWGEWFDDQDVSPDEANDFAEARGEDEAEIEQRNTRRSVTEPINPDDAPPFDELVVSDLDDLDGPA